MLNSRNKQIKDFYISRNRFGIGASFVLTIGFGIMFYLILRNLDGLVADYANIVLGSAFFGLVIFQCCVMSNIKKYIKQDYKNHFRYKKHQISKAKDLLRKEGITSI